VFGEGAAVACFALTGDSVRSTAAVGVHEAGLKEERPARGEAAAADMPTAADVCLVSASSSEKSSVSIIDDDGGTGREAARAVRRGSANRDGTTATGRVRWLPLSVVTNPAPLRRTAGVFACVPLHFRCCPGGREGREPLCSLFPLRVRQFVCRRFVRGAVHWLSVRPAEQRIKMAAMHSIPLFLSNHSICTPFSSFLVEFSSVLSVSQAAARRANTHRPEAH
jgi:hypothetical protein